MCTATICCCTDLDSGLSKINSKRQFLAAEHIRIMSLLEHVFQLIQLEACERCTIATLLPLRCRMLSCSFAPFTDPSNNPCILFTQPPMRRMRICFTYVFFAFFVFAFFPSATTMRQPFSGTPERIFMKLLPKDSGENGVFNVVPKWG